MTKKIKIGVVGACGSGKSSLVLGLVEHGFHAHHIAQEHSFAPDMWQRFTNPDLLVYLHVTYPTTLKRKNFNWMEEEYHEQMRRMKHAIDHADIIIETDGYSPAEIIQLVLKELS